MSGLVGAMLALGVGVSVGPAIAAPQPAAAQIRLMVPVEDYAPRGWPVSRDLDRPALHPDLTVKGRRYVNKAVTVRVAPAAKAKAAGRLKVGANVQVTAHTSGTWRMIVRKGTGVWVPSRRLEKKKPVRTAALSTAPCAAGSAMERGLTHDAVAVHRALCARYPQVTSFGGLRADANSFHSSGRAVDAMISNREVGQEMATWLRTNAHRLGVSEIIYAQHIWTVQRSGEGWRAMSDRGSVSANHYDHVHISVYGSAAAG